MANSLPSWLSPSVNRLCKADGVFGQVALRLGSIPNNVNLLCHGAARDGDAVHGIWGL
jgi:hypothetical protein